MSTITRAKAGDRITGTYETVPFSGLCEQVKTLSEDFIEYHIVLDEAIALPDGVRLTHIYPWDNPDGLQRAKFHKINR